jgi:uncharacterized Zn finger protein
MTRFDDDRYEWTRPLPAHGVAARSRRGAIGETWWSRRFIELLESFGIGSRLQRGRSYARAGQVTELDVEPGIVLARVQGSRHTPYKVRIRCAMLSEAQWRRAEKAMAAAALPLASLLAGEMPRDIEDMFGSCKLALFPRSIRELKATCSCPDAANPCKHVAAVYYILAERFDDDPFLIFAWRGRERDELLGRLRRRRGRVAAAPRDTPSSAPPHATPLPLDAFWDPGLGLDELRICPLASAAPDAVLRRLGPAPAESAGRNVAELLAPAYIALAQAAERRALRD